MTKKVCLAVMAVQAFLFATAIGVSFLASAGNISQGVGEVVGKFSAMAFVALAPFGMMSAALSIAFPIMAKSRKYGRETRYLLSSNYPIMFFVWREVRETLTSENEGK